MSGGGLTGKSAIREAHYALFLCRRPIKMSPVCRLGMAPPSGVLWARFGECGTVVFPKRGKRSIFRCEQIRNRAICRECDHHLRFPSTSRFCRIFSRLGGKKFPVIFPVHGNCRRTVIRRFPPSWPKLREAAALPARRTADPQRQSKPTIDQTTSKINHQSWEINP